MSKQALAKDIIDAIAGSIGSDGSKYNEGTPSMANAAIANAITSYIINNTTITSVYSGVIAGTPPVTDPIVGDTHSVIGTCAPPSGTDFDSWINSLWSNISSGFFIGAGKVGVTVMAPTLAFTGNISASSLPDILKKCTEEDDPQTYCWEAIADVILQAINASPSLSGAASNTSSGSTGSVTSTVTVIS